MFRQVSWWNRLCLRNFKFSNISRFYLLLCALEVVCLVACLVAIIYSSLLFFWDPSKKFYRRLQNMSLINFRKTDSLTNIFLPAETQNKLFCRCLGKKVFLTKLSLSWIAVVSLSCDSGQSEHCHLCALAFSVLYYLITSCFFVKKHLMPFFKLLRVSPWEPTWLVMFFLYMFINRKNRTWRLYFCALEQQYSIVKWRYFFFIIQIVIV